MVHFPLHPETPAEGSSMAEMYAARGADPKAHARHQYRIRVRSVDSMAFSAGSATDASILSTSVTT